MQQQTRGGDETTRLVKTPGWPSMIDPPRLTSLCCSLVETVTTAASGRESRETATGGARDRLATAEATDATATQMRTRRAETTGIGNVRTGTRPGATAGQRGNGTVTVARPGAMPDVTTRTGTADETATHTTTDAAGAGIAATMASTAAAAGTPRAAAPRRLPPRSASPRPT